MKKPPIPTFIAAYPQPAKNPNLITNIAIALILILAIIIYLDYRAWNKTLQNENS